MNVKLVSSVALSLAIGAASASSTLAQEAASDFASLMDLSLEELLDIEVTTVSRRGQSLSSAPAAVFVINQRDIRRSGAQSVPDLLRIVPGINVAQIDGNKWAITARGINGRVAGKLLVMMDGRTVYSPLFSGVFWDAQDLDLSTIERIEVIRGPGATLWGANAVNGVINIITARADATPGGHASASVGTEGGSGVLRFGGALARDWDYRVFAKARDYDGNVDYAGNPTADALESNHIGLRLDRDGPERDHISLTTEVYDSELGVTAVEHALVPPYHPIEDAVEHSRGGFAMISWEHEIDTRSRFTFRSYYDSVQRDLLVHHRFDNDTFDVDFQYELAAGARHNVIWGAGYRHTQDSVVAHHDDIDPLEPPSDEQRWASLFVQDEIALKQNKSYLTLGTKLEETNYMDGVEAQPNVRLRWHPNDSSTFWASMAKALRLPSRGDRDGHIVTGVLPPGSAENPSPLPMLIAIRGSRNLKPEQLVASELGYRIQATERLAFDIAAFEFDYDDDRSISAAAPLCLPQGVPINLDPGCLLAADFVEQPLQLANESELKTYGWEVVADWWPTDWWRMQSSVSMLRARNDDIDETPMSGDVSLLSGPEYQATLRSMMNLGSKTELDLTLRYVDELAETGIDAYTALDVRLGFTPTTKLRISLVARDLLAGDHVEFISELNEVVPVELLQRNYLEVLWSF